MPTVTTVGCLFFCPEGSRKGSLESEGQRFGATHPTEAKVGGQTVFSSASNPSEVRHRHEIHDFITAEVVLTKMTSVYYLIPSSY